MFEHEQRHKHFYQLAFPLVLPGKKERQSEKVCHMLVYCQLLCFVSLIGFVLCVFVFYGIF